MANTEELRKSTHQKLSKYNTSILIEKLEKGTLLGLSAEVAKEIVEKRQSKLVDNSTKKEEPVKEEQEEPAKEEKPKAEKVKKEKKEKVVKEKKERKARTASFEPIDEEDKKVSAILDSPIARSKTYKIQELLKLGYSINQISKSSLKAHYSFVFTIKKKMEEESK